MRESRSSEIIRDVSGPTAMRTVWRSFAVARKPVESSLQSGGGFGVVFSWDFAVSLVRTA